MKAGIKDLTVEMDQDELIKTLNDNLKKIDDMAEQRENAIKGRLNEVRSDIQGLRTDLFNISANLEAVLSHFKIKPVKKLLTDERVQGKKR